MHVSDCSSLKRGLGPPNLHHWQMAWGYWVTEEGIIPRAHFRCGHGNNKHGIISQEAEPGTTESSGQGALPREHTRVQSRNFSCLHTRGPSQCLPSRILMLLEPGIHCVSPIVIQWKFLWLLSCPSSIIVYWLSMYVGLREWEEV